MIFLLYLEEAEFRNSRRVLKCDKNKDAQAGWYKKMVFRGSVQTFEPEGMTVERSAPVTGQVTLREVTGDYRMPF